MYEDASRNPKLGVLLLGDPHNKDHNILGSTTLGNYHLTPQYTEGSFKSTIQACHSARLLQNSSEMRKDPRCGKKGAS